jgi:hypothetical protein
MSQGYRPTPHPTRRTTQILLSLWVVLTLAQLAFVLGYGHNQPWADEWEFVPTLTGHEPVGPFFLNPHNEHRLPLPRLIYVALWELTHDFRSGMVLQVCLLSIMAYRGMHLAEWRRGRPHWADAFFPLTLLHVGHCENLLMGYQLCFVLASALAFGVLELAVRATPQNGPRTTWLAALAALALALCGGFGIILAVPILVWVGSLVVTRTPETSPPSPLSEAERGNRNRPLCQIAISLVTVAYIAYYFATYERPPTHPPFAWKNWVASFEVAGQFLAISFGIGVGAVWFVVLPVLLLASGTAIRTRGIFAVAVGAILLALAIGASRGGFNSQMGMGLWPRYSVLAWLFPAATYLASLNHRDARSHWMPIGMATLAILAYFPNTIYGLNYGNRHDYRLSAMEQQLSTGESADGIVQHLMEGTGQEARARIGIPMLHAAKIGPFAEWKGTP